MTHPQAIETLNTGASYEVSKYKVTENGLEDAGREVIRFTKGSKSDPTVFKQEGLLTETLLAVCAQYLRDVNVGELTNRDTSLAITHIEDAILRLGKRAEDRKIRGVQTTYSK